MTDLSDEFFETALAGVQERLDDLITQSKKDSDPPDKYAKSMSALMKAQEDILARQANHKAAIAAKTHTRYEDMPPPTPEDEARFYARFEKLVKSIAESSPDEEAL